MSATLQNGSFYGRPATTPLQLGGITLAETSYAAEFVVPRHDHAHPIICLGLAGRFTEHTGRRRDVLGARCVFFQPAGEEHAETFHETRARLFNVQLGDAWLGMLDPYGLRLPASPMNASRGRLSMLAMQLHAEYRLREGPLRMAVDGLVLSMIAELTRCERRRERWRQPAWLATAVAVLHDRFREGIGLAELAAAAQVDPSHLASTFRARYGCTVGAYLRSLRLEHARTTLADTTLPLARVAIEAGFADQSHMTRAFRAAFDTTPAEYRRRVR